MTGISAMFRDLDGRDAALWLVAMWCERRRARRNASARARHTRPDVKAAQNARSTRNTMQRYWSDPAWREELKAKRRERYRRSKERP